MAHSMNSVGVGVVGATAGFRSAAAVIREKDDQQSSLPSTKKTKTFGGFSSAKDVMKSQNANGAKDGTNPGASSAEKMAPPTAGKNKDAVTPNENEINIDLLVRGLCYHKENLSSLKSISLHREPMNMFDANAIAVKNDIGVVGHIAREQAALLSPYLDDSSISIDSVTVKTDAPFRSTGILAISVRIDIMKLEKKDDIHSMIVTLNTNQTGVTTTFETIDSDVAKHLSIGIAAQDIQTARECSVDFSEVKTLPWKTDDQGNAVLWPPCNDVMAKFGYGNVDDGEWWGKNGMNPPTQWIVSGAMDILPNVSVSKHQKQLAKEILNDAIHGVTNIWSDETMNEIGVLMHSAEFWSHRGADAFIKAFGGPYILGQQEGKLKLIKGNPHVALTEKLCRGHNIVYTLLHAEKPAEPGFNTLIFGLNLQRSGFHYHQDAIGSLKAKNAPLLPRQPVVTTVYYQKPQLDEGKEIVLWKPLMNFRPKEDSLYAAARGVVTSHGMVHVQKAGLQRKALHGIFRTPFSTLCGNRYELEPRMGYRVAITARITYDYPENRLEPFLKENHYKAIIGPGGNKTLSL